MGWKVEQRDDGKWDWFVYNSAWGAGSGVADTEAEAHVELAITEAAIFEQPYPEVAKEAMRANPVKTAREFGHLTEEARGVVSEPDSTMEDR